VDLRAAAVALALGLVLPACGSVRAEPADTAFAESLPPGVADVSRWELVSGDFETSRMRGGYRFYVNPERVAMYQVMRYRVQRLSSGAERGDARLGAERVVFVRRPGIREPIECWERQAPGAATEWLALVPGTAEYQREMLVLTEVLAVHRAARTGR
jgi:hypothetical protein